MAYAQNLSLNTNDILFHCTAKPGLSRVLVKLYDFQGTAVRTRRAGQLRSGPLHAPGWFVGQTVREAVLGHGWEDGIVMGCSAADPVDDW